MVICVFVDLKRAFETVDRTRLLRKLRAIGINGTELKWFKSYLSNRSQTTKFDDRKSVSIANDLGLPQGSVLSALLFIIYINDIKKVFKHCKIKLFADDTLIH